MVLVLDDPALRSAAAREAAQKHRAIVAAHAVVMPGNVTVDPTPHKAPSANSFGKGNRDATSGEEPNLSICTESAFSAVWTVEAAERKAASDRSNLSLDYESAIRGRSYGLVKSTLRAAPVAVIVAVTRRSPYCGCLKMKTRVPSITCRFAIGVSPAFLPSTQTSAHG